jgi:hypothetical protein
MNRRWGWNGIATGTKKTNRVLLTAQSRGGKTPLRRAADQHFGRSEGDRGTGCWAELLVRRESRRGFEQPQKLNTWRQEITDQQLSTTFTELRYPLLRKVNAPKIIRLLQDSVPKQNKQKFLLGYCYHHCACTFSLNRLSFAFPPYKFGHCVCLSFFLDFYSPLYFSFAQPHCSFVSFFNPPPPPRFVLHSLFHPSFVSLVSLLLSFLLSLSF